MRIGTAAVTTRGFVEADMEEIAEIIDETIKNKDAEDLTAIQDKVKNLCKKYPLYPEI